VLLYTLEFLFVGIGALAIGSGIVMAATIFGPSLFRTIVA
jgi:hypothetical protein